MSVKKSYLGIKNSVENSTVELFFTDFIYDGIDWSTWEETNMVQDTIDKIKAANPSKIIVTINSLGGDVMIGLAIYNFLKSYNAEVEVNVIGFAASIASVIAMSASDGKLKMANNSFMILHAASTYAAGNAKDMRDQAEILDKVSGELADIYAQRTGKEANYFTNLWADGGDVWLTAKECKELGLVDELTSAAPITARVDLSAYGFKNIPAQLTAAVNSILNNSTKNIMAFQKTLVTAGAEKLDVVEGGFLLEEKHLTAIENKLAENETALSAAVTNAATANAEVTRLTAELATANTAKIAAETEASGHKTKITQLEAQVAELGSQSSGSGTILNTGGDTTEGGEKVPYHLSAANPMNAWLDKKHKVKPATT